MLSDWLKPIAGGMFIGAMLFIMPFFLIHLAIFFCFVSIFFRMMWRGKMRRGDNFGPQVWAERVRNMSDDEYEQFKLRLQTKGCHSHRNRGFQNPNSDNQTSATV